MNRQVQKKGWFWFWFWFLFRRDLMTTARQLARNQRPPPLPGRSLAGQVKRRVCLTDEERIYQSERWIQYMCTVHKLGLTTTRQSKNAEYECNNYPDDSFPSSSSSSSRRQTFYPHARMLVPCALAIPASSPYLPYMLHYPYPSLLTHTSMKISQGTANQPTSHSIPFFFLFDEPRPWRGRRGQKEDEQERRKRRGKEEKRD